MSDEYYIDILEPSKDLNASMEALGSSIGVLYQKHWAEDLQSSYEKVFDLNIQAFANMWFDGILKLFVAKTFDGSKPLGCGYPPQAHDVQGVCVFCAGLVRRRGQTAGRGAL